VEVLCDLIKIIKPKRAFIFVNGAEAIDKAVNMLKVRHNKAVGLSGNNTKLERQKALNDFIKGSCSLLVASDLAARGLHVEGVPTVFHISMPESPLDYLHRVGRTGRGDTRGLSVSLVTQKEQALINQYEKQLSITISEKQLSKSRNKLVTL
jgi:superfamily II DNA/RNA helicase